MNTITLRLTSPFHHGAGSSGNTSILRTEDVIQADGTIARVPFLSANSIRNGLRSALAWHTLKTIDAQDGTLSKPIIDLLFSGGAISRTGSETSLDQYRDVEEILPWLAMLGYAAGSTITEGTLRVSNFILQCEENRDRLTLQDSLKRAAHYRGETFGTRVDQSTSPVARFIQAADELTGTTQMIYSTQVLSTGAVLEGTVSLTPAATPIHQTCLDAAITLWAPGGTAFVGAKTATGYGRAQLTQSNPGDPDALANLTELLLAQKDRILPLLESLVSAK